MPHSQELKSVTHVLAIKTFFNSRDDVFLKKNKEEFGVRVDRHASTETSTENLSESSDATDVNFNTISPRFPERDFPLNR